ncbi:phosphatase domain-containing putative toxin [Maridesulfovibrio frigidus]|uniref:phosphatase domain-containing putative toxin n=1 Tax=Maridesulfovibrio frigidus TaxID=340956 RepID=UPI00068C01E6|nr:hypothetical protein [Maridesulfovibrio frigidus]
MSAKIFFPIKTRILDDIFKLILASFVILLIFNSNSFADDSVLILDAPAVENLPRNFRTSAFPFKNSTDSPSRTGLDTLKISGSGQFSADQFDVMRSNLPATVTVVDLRQEFHGNLNGAAVCWFSYRDSGNKGLDSAQVTSGEQEALSLLGAQKEIQLGMNIIKNDDGGFKVDKKYQLKPHTVYSEHELMGARGVGYIRIACTDHLRPPDVAVERFVKFVRNLKSDVWLHFHCRAGKGRTTTFMLMYDMLRNANKLDLGTLAARQKMIGGSGLLGKVSTDKEWKIEIGHERQNFIRKFYDYAKANPNGLPMTWLEWQK